MNVVRTWESSLWRIAFDCYGDQIHRFLLKRLGRQEAEDVAQEVYVKLMQVSNDERIQNPEGYIFAVARQVACDAGRRVRSDGGRLSIDSPQLEYILENPTEAGLDRVEQAVSSEQFLQTFLAEVPPRQAVVILMFERDGYSYAEIAAELHVSERAVRRYLIKARTRLQKMLLAVERNSSDSAK